MLLVLVVLGVGCGGGGVGGVGDEGVGVFPTAVVSPTWVGDGAGVPVVTEVALGGPVVSATATLPVLPATMTVVPLITDTPRPSATPVVPDSGWVLLRPGLERRVILVQDGAGLVLDSMYVLRIDPAGYEFGVAYRPGEPQSLTEWQAETGALLVVNGGYFTAEYVATGLIVADGVASGVSYDGFAGMLAIDPAGPSLRWLALQPYDPAEGLIGAIQSFPLLVKPGGVLGFPEETGRAARRTVMGMDGSGRVLFILTQRHYYTLHQLSQFLVESDFELDIALNLDGGPSTGLILTEPPEQVPALSVLPAVITVSPR